MFRSLSRWSRSTARLAQANVAQVVLANAVARGTKNAERLNRRVLAHAGPDRDGDRALRRARQPENKRCADPLRNALGAMPPTSVINWNRATCAAVRAL